MRIEIQEALDKMAERAARRLKSEFHASDEVTMDAIKRTLREEVKFPKDFPSIVYVENQTAKKLGIGG